MVRASLFCYQTPISYPHRATRSTSLSSSSSSRETSWRIESRRSVRGEWISNILHLNKTSLSSVLSQHILICNPSSVLSFRATLYPCPETPQERKEMLAGVNARIDDLQMVNALSGKTPRHCWLTNMNLHQIHLNFLLLFSFCFRLHHSESLEEIT